MKIGPYRVYVLTTEMFKLDGGAMFGSVPKVLWERCLPADERNRISLAARSLLLKSEEPLSPNISANISANSGSGLSESKAARTILVDLGCGDKWSERERDIFDIKPTTAQPLRVMLPEVTDVILTHLHFDHAGGVSCYDAQGKAVLSFPAARHYLQEGHWVSARSPSVRERASFLSADIEALLSAGSGLSGLELLSPGVELFPGLSLPVFSGHSQGLQGVLLSDAQQKLFFASDLIPTSHHLPLPYIMGYDNCARETLREKEAVLARAVAEDWIVVFQHDPQLAACRVTRDAKGRYAVREEVNIEEFFAER